MQGTTAAAAATTLPNQAAPAVKALKSRLVTLLEARTPLAANVGCAEALAAVDAQVARARADLAHAQPLEVALRGTLGAVTAARQALQRAEAKTTKLELQVVSAVSAYEVAAAELQTCRKSLADAEAATARTAGGHIDLRQFFGSDPGAAWATSRAACEQRCMPGAGGVSDAVRNRAAAAVAEMQAICALLPAQPLSQPPVQLSAVPHSPPQPSSSYAAVAAAAAAATSLPPTRNTAAIGDGGGAGPTGLVGTALTQPSPLEAAISAHAGQGGAGSS